MKKKTIILVDGNSLIHKAYHALPPLTSPDGRLVNAVYGFLAILFRALKETSPDFITVAFDAKGKTFRHKIYPKYKATRVDKGPELYDQFPIIKDILRDLEIPYFESPGFEGDDIVATLSTQAQRQDLNTVILSGDLDNLQLVSPQISVSTMRRGLTDVALFDEKELQKRYGILPSQMIDYKALVGDPSDNIAGVPGIGPKTAAELLQKFENLDKIFKNLDKLPEKQAEILKKQKKEIWKAREIVSLKTDLPLRLDLKSSKLADFDREKVRKKFLKLGFRTLVERIPVSSRKKSVQLNIF